MTAARLLVETVRWVLLGFAAGLGLTTTLMLAVLALGALAGAPPPPVPAAEPSGAGEQVRPPAGGARPVDPAHYAQAWPRSSSTSGRA